VIKAKRKAKGMKRIALARAAKVTPAYITQLETGERKNPSLAVLKKIASALGVPVGILTKTGGDTKMSSSAVVWDSDVIRDDFLTPELLLWNVLREFRSGLTPHELTEVLRERDLAKGDIDAIEGRVTEMLKEMCRWSAQRRVERRGVAYRARLESDQA
jgi:transcriptional regulator with XRE-family HTH domain